MTYYKPKYGHFGMPPDQKFDQEKDAHTWLKNHFLLVKKQHKDAKLELKPHGKIEILVNDKPYRTFAVEQGKDGKIELYIVRGRDD
jgi:hypothetical protein